MGKKRQPVSVTTHFLSTLPFLLKSGWKRKGLFYWGPCVFSFSKRTVEDTNINDPAVSPFSHFHIWRTHLTFPQLRATCPVIDMYQNSKCFRNEACDWHCAITVCENFSFLCLKKGAGECTVILEELEKRKQFFKKPDRCTVKIWLIYTEKHPSKTFFLV